MQSATLSLSTLTAASPLHAARNSFMTDAFGKHQIVACRGQIRKTRRLTLPTRSLVNTENALLYLKYVAHP